MTRSRPDLIPPAVAAAVLLLSACADGRPPLATPSLPLVSHGERIAQRECGECHGLRDGQPSPLADAPSFPALRPNYSREAMAEVLGRRIEEIHPRMPTPRMDIDEAVYFLDYWAAIPPRAVP